MKLGPQPDWDALWTRVKELEAGIRKHRDERRDEELYALLGDDDSQHSDARPCQ